MSWNICVIIISARGWRRALPQLHLVRFTKGPTLDPFLQCLGLRSGGEVLEQALYNAVLSTSRSPASRALSPLPFLLFTVNRRGPLTKHRYTPNKLQCIDNIVELHRKQRKNVLLLIMGSQRFECINKLRNIFHCIIFSEDLPSSTALSFISLCTF